MTRSDDLLKRHHRHQQEGLSHGEMLLFIDQLWEALCESEDKLDAADAADAQHDEDTAELTRLLEDIEDMFDRVFILKEPPRDVAGLRQRVERALRP